MTRGSDSGTGPCPTHLKEQPEQGEQQVTATEHRTARLEFPNELDILITREFDAPIAVVFDVLTKPEHVRKWGAYPSDPMTKCSIDLRVGGTYHHSFVTEEGTECSFSGTYLEVEPPVRTVETWLFGGWPDAEAVETWQLHETDGVTTVTMRLAFRDKAGRDHHPAREEDAGDLTSSGGPSDSFDAMDEILRSLLDPNGMISA
jgi:uncharacterized protein YndB with AHSA1/START domain